MNDVISAHRDQLQTVRPGTVCVLTLDAAHCIEYGNLEFERACGYRQVDLLRRPLDHLVHPDVPGEVLRDVWATLAAGATWVAPIKWRCTDGRAAWIRTTFAPIRRMAAANHSMVVGTHVTPLQARAAESVYLAMHRWGLAWREAVARSHRQAPKGANASELRS